VEVIEVVNLIRIQIGLEFRKDLKNKKSLFHFPIGHGPKPSTLAQSSLPQLLSCTAQDQVIPYPMPDG
jgi:hypothetical protein